MKPDCRLILCYCLEPGDEVLVHSGHEAKRLTLCGISYKGHLVVHTDAPTDCPLCKLAETDPDLLTVEDKVPAGTAS